jgi:hypothetical protein
MRNSAQSTTVTSTPSLALGAFVAGLLAKAAARFFGASGPDASVTLSDLGNQADSREA